MQRIKELVVTILVHEPSFDNQNVDSVSRRTRYN